ncbi:hypothetical protein QTN25_001052 [Entamoeba marina]
MMLQQKQAKWIYNIINRQDILNNQREICIIFSTEFYSPSKQIIDWNIPENVIAKNPIEYFNKRDMNHVETLLEHYNNTYKIDDPKGDLVRQLIDIILDFMSLPYEGTEVQVNVPIELVNNHLDSIENNGS